MYDYYFTCHHGRTPLLHCSLGFPVRSGRIKMFVPCAIHMYVHQTHKATHTHIHNRFTKSVCQVAQSLLRLYYNQLVNIYVSIHDGRQSTHTHIHTRLMCLLHEHCAIPMAIVLMVLQSPLPTSHHVTWKITQWTTRTTMGDGWWATSKGSTSSCLFNINASCPVTLMCVCVCVCRQREWESE